MKEGVSVRKLSFSRGEVDILRNISIRVSFAHIYCLLGPSGCGKTTLLRCIIGRLKPGDGEISIFGYPLGHPKLNVPGFDVGYMPQEYAVYDNLTIEENIFHFARINQVSESEIKSQCVQLCGLLDLPKRQHLVKNLSGGQRRRVSLVCSLLHRPKLVILDEPTAGVDPILAQKIWTHLEWLSKSQNTTIILTTHYIEEARRANCIGFLRKGRLVVENSPEALQKITGKISLESVFLHLCDLRRKSTIFTAQDVHNYREDRTKSLSAIEKVGGEKRESQYCVDLVKSWLKTFIALVRTNIWMESRDPLCIVFQYFIPIIMMSLSFICFGGTPFDVKIGYVHSESDYASSMTDIDKKFVDLLDNHRFIKMNYYNLSLAYPDLQAGKVWGVLNIPMGFDYALHNRTDINAASNVINQSTITLYADLSHKILAMTALESIENTFIDWLSEFLKEFKENVKKADPYVMLADPIYGKFKKDDYSGYRKYALPGFLLNCTLAIAMSVSSILLISSKQNQTIERTFVCGVTTGQMLLAHAFSRCIISISYVMVAVYCSWIFFEPEYPEMISLVAFPIFLQIFTGTAIGICLSAIFNEISAAMNVVSAIYIILLFTTGSIWPMESINLNFRWICRSLPISGSAEAFRSALFRGWSFFHPFVWSKLLCDIVWSMNFIFISYFLMEKTSTL